MTEEGVAVSTEGALRAAFERHYLSLVRLCVLLEGRQAEAEDLVQEAFVRLASKIDRIPPEGVGPYVRRVVINLWKNRRRRLAADVRARLRAWTRPEEQSPPADDHEVLWSSVLLLPARQRACVVLRYYEDLPEREVAAVLGCTVGTVKSQTSRALARLRKELRR